MKLPFTSSSSHPGSPPPGGRSDHARAAGAPRPVPWNDRTTLLPKRMAYVFSLHVGARVRGRSLQVLERANGLAHLMGDQMVELPEGFRCETPAGPITGGEGEIGGPGEPTSTALRMRISAELEGLGPLLIEAQGVLDFKGGPAVFWSEGARPLRGSAFIATRYETAQPAFRWLNRRQLFGVGRVETQPGQPDRLTLDLSFDLYAAA